MTGPGDYPSPRLWNPLLFWCERKNQGWGFLSQLGTLLQLPSGGGSQAQSILQGRSLSCSAPEVPRSPAPCPPSTDPMGHSSPAALCRALQSQAGSLGDQLLPFGHQGIPGSPRGNKQSWLHWALRSALGSGATGHPSPSSPRAPAAPSPVPGVLTSTSAHILQPSSAWLHLRPSSWAAGRFLGCPSFGEAPHVVNPGHGPRDEALEFPGVWEAPCLWNS